MRLDAQVPIRMDMLLVRRGMLLWNYFCPFEWVNWGIGMQHLETFLCPRPHPLDIEWERTGVWIIPASVESSTSYRIPSKTMLPLESSVALASTLLNYLTDWCRLHIVSFSWFQALKVIQFQSSIQASNFESFLSDSILFIHFLHLSFTLFIFRSRNQKTISTPT